MTMWTRSLDSVFGDRDPSHVDQGEARELALEFNSYAFAVGNFRTAFERSGTFTQFRSQLERDAVGNRLFQDCLRVLDWIEASRVQQKTLLEIGLAPHELLLVSPCAQLLLMRFFASVTAAESDQVRAFIDSLDPAAPGPYGELSSRVLTVLNSALSMLRASQQVLAEHPELRT